mgnify:CR=1 FL=1
MKRNAVLLLLCLTLMLPGCAGQNHSPYSKYTYEFLGAFDTVIQFMGYAKNQEAFEEMVQIGQNRFAELHKLFDIYYDYEGINNIKTINDNAGIKPVEVSQEIIDLIVFSKEWYHKTNGKCNIALGPVLAIWHDYRETGSANPEAAELPPMESLREASKYTDIDKVSVDEEKKTVYLEDEHMRLDVGAVAKGFASEIVTKELEAKGYTSFIVSSGGNVRTSGKPLNGARTKWGIGLQNPDGNPNDPNDPPIDIAFLTDQSMVTSGDYQRYYMVNGKKYHHLIDPETLMPADYFRAVTIITKDSGLADFMSTTIFLTPFEEGLQLAESLGIEAVWIMGDGTIRATGNAKNMLKNLGGAKNTE